MRLTHRHTVSFTEPSACFSESPARRYDNVLMQRIRRLDPTRVLGGAVALVFILLVVGMVLAAIAGSVEWPGALSGAVAAIVAAIGLLYAWRLGAPGRRR
jgi:membrane associated rhomboid family serine protease